MTPRVTLFWRVERDESGETSAAGDPKRTPTRHPVMAGLVPAIHAAPLQTTVGIGRCVTAWMAGKSPAMTMRVGNDGGERGPRR
jgi:hypothetical protein